MNRSYEKRTLKQIAKLLDSGNRKPWTSVLFMLVLYALGAIAIIVSYILVTRGILSAKWGIFIASFGGAFVGVASYFGVAMKQWPALRPHIDRESLEKRLGDIET